MNRLLLAFLAVSLLALTPSVAEAKGFGLKKVKGDLSSDDADLKGKFSLRGLTASGKGGERLYVLAKGLDSDVEYDVRLGADAKDAVSFGEMTVRGKRGIGHMRFSSKRDDYPEGVDSLLDFGGDSIFVMDGDEVVLEGEIPNFVSLTDKDVEEGAIAFGIGKVKLDAADEDARDYGRVVAVAVNSSKGTREVLSVFVAFLDKGEEYDVVLVGKDGADDDELGTIEARGRFGFGVLVIDTGRGGELPDFVGDLAGRTIEVRDADGDVVLSGEMPELE